MLINSDSRFFAPILIHLVLVILSSLFSEYGYFCTHGMPDQFETVWNLIAYVVALFYCYYIVVYQTSETAEIQLVFGGAFFVGLICVLQYFHIDIYRLIYAGESYTFTFAEGTVYGSFYNINYVGYYTLLFIPLFVLVLLCYPNAKVKIMAAVLTVFLLISMIGADSIVAEIAFAFVCVFALVFVLLKNVKSKRILWIPIIAVFAAGTIVCAVAVPLVGQYIQASNTEKRNLENIYTDDDYVEIDYKGQKLFIQMQQDAEEIDFVIEDQNQTEIGCDVAYTEEGYYYYTIADARFAGMTLTPAVVA